GSRAGVSYPLPAIIEEHLPIIIFVSVGLGRSTLPLAADCFLPRSLLGLRQGLICDPFSL
ncbi:MAG TPA: hypothetical protein VNN08_24650, partial [Thermoanaerobaculia bacterium]|nr:hypothetical protein [Thermoanaerobaculia bacterium]